VSCHDDSICRLITASFAPLNHLAPGVCDLTRF
jgi:hypothetical protein